MDTENVVQVSDAAYGPLVKKAQLPGSSTLQKLSILIIKR